MSEGATTEFPAIITEPLRSFSSEWKKPIPIKEALNDRPLRAGDMIVLQTQSESGKREPLVFMVNDDDTGGELPKSVSGHIVAKVIPLSTNEIIENNISNGEEPLTVSPTGVIQGEYADADRQIFEGNPPLLVIDQAVSKVLLIEDTNDDSPTTSPIHRSFPIEQLSVSQVTYAESQQGEERTKVLDQLEKDTQVAINLAESRVIKNVFLPGFILSLIGTGVVGLSSHDVGAAIITFIGAFGVSVILSGEDMVNKGRKEVEKINDSANKSKIDQIGRWTQDDLLSLNNQIMKITGAKIGSINSAILFE